MDIVLSGIRPTGNLHMGNYFGAVRNFVKIQDLHPCYFFIADWHSLTTHPTPVDLHGNVRNVLVNILHVVWILKKLPYIFKAMYLKRPNYTFF